MPCNQIVLESSLGMKLAPKVEVAYIIFVKASSFDGAMLEAVKIHLIVIT